MEREHKKKRITETPPASLESVPSDDTTTRIIRKKRFNIQEQYDQKFIDLTTDIVALQANLDAMRVVLESVDERITVLEQTMARIMRNSENIVSASDKGANERKRKADAARAMIREMDEPYCARCNEFGHHDC